MKKLNIRNILVPIDFSQASIEAIQTAKNLARRFLANVHIVHVHNLFYSAAFTPTPIGVPGMVSGLPVNVIRDMEKRLTRDLKDIGKRFRVSPANCHLCGGAPVFDEICGIAQEIRVDLIVTSTHGHTGLKHIFLGSTAERLVQHAPCPVLVSRKGRTTIDKILVPVDFSRCSLEGLKYAFQFADQFAAKLFIVHAVYFGEPYTSDGFALYDLSALEKQQRKNAEQRMGRFIRQAKFGRVRFEAAVETGDPTDQINAFAERERIDLIITSTHGRTGFTHVLMGSTAEEVVRRASRSVLVVPSHPEVRVGNLRDSRSAGREIRGQRPKPRSIRSGDLSKRSTKLTRHPFPERRKTNKFRESHLIS